MAYGTRIRFDLLRQITANTIPFAFSKLGPITTDFTRILVVNNSADVQVCLSFDGIDEHIFILSDSSRTYNFTSNRIDTGSLFLAKGTQIFVRNDGTPATRGIVSVEIIYAEGGK